MTSKERKFQDWIRGNHADLERIFCPVPGMVVARIKEGRFPSVEAMDAQFTNDAQKLGCESLSNAVQSWMVGSHACYQATLAMVEDREFPKQGIDDLMGRVVAVCPQKEAEMMNKLVDGLDYVARAEIAYGYHPTGLGASRSGRDGSWLSQGWLDSHYTTEPRMVLVGVNERIYPPIMLDAFMVLMCDERGFSFIDDPDLTRRVIHDRTTYTFVKDVLIEGARGVPHPDFNLAGRNYRLVEVREEHMDLDIDELKRQGIVCDVERVHLWNPVE